MKAALGTPGIPKMLKSIDKIEVELTLVRKSVGVRLGFIGVRQGLFWGFQISVICGCGRLGSDYSHS